MRRIVFVLSVSALLFFVGCGSGNKHSSTGSTSASGGNTIVPPGSSNNVAPVIVDGGLSNATSNVSYTTVVICAPGTSNCATFDHISVDTASTGLRIPATAFPTVANGAAVLAALQNVNPGAPLAECVEFLDNTFFWGSVRSADVKMGGSSNTGEVASSVPIQVLGDLPSSSIPAADCTGTEQDTIGTLHENGRLGVGTYQYDCDALGFPNQCISSGTLPPGTYYACAGSSCSNTNLSVPLDHQVRNPVSLFATDNNGVILELPSVPASGQTGVSAGQASLVFGIGTQSNNELGSAVVLTLDSDPSHPDWSGITTVYNGIAYPNSTADNTLLANGSHTFGSFIDSGSNAIFFLDQPLTGIPDCTFNVDFYCPSGTENLMAVNQATGGNSDTVQFSVFNADMIPAGFTAFSGLAGPNTSNKAGIPNALTQAHDGYFDWGLSFFYGRNVYTSIWGVTPPNGVPQGPFWAY